MTEGTEVEGLATPARRRPGPAITAVVAASLIAALAWWATTPDALSDAAGTTVGMAAPTDGSLFVGQYGTASHDVVIERVEPVVVDGLAATVWMCHPVHGSDPIGSMRAADVDEFCTDLVPVERGTVLPGYSGTPPDETLAYLLVELEPTADHPQGFCGLDVTYRDGWRKGRHRQAGGPQAITNAPTEDDDLFGDAGDLLDACPVALRE
ncbi:hypothetical protein [Nitriliruptor alkaliphilus]|uniref:hypothetical protein n=1 Tax=Nitriliruptor alkaliphilus TaxID=427918 RepID=UPI0012EDECE4|nr:hypothetical protein [Nitriliruptor alkaliphilus]